MRERHVVVGPGHRVQLFVIDLTGEDVPPAIRDERPKFGVYVLPATANKYAAFSVAGRQVYYGDDPDAAWDSAARYCPTLLQQLPRPFRQFMLRWKKQDG